MFHDNSICICYYILTYTRLEYNTIISTKIPVNNKRNYINLQIYLKFEMWGDIMRKGSLVSQVKDARETPLQEGEE